MIYKNEKTRNISFPLGGIGTGCIGLAGNGELNEWEIFNRPNKNTRNGFSHFAIKATRGGKSIVRVLHGDTNESFLGISCQDKHQSSYSYGVRESSLAGFPHFKNLTFEGNFPVAKLTFEDDDFPAVIRLCALNPFIAHDEFNSSIPAAFFEWEIENTANEDVEFAIACTVQNPAESGFNKTVSTDKYNGLMLVSDGVDKTEVGYSDLCILTDGSNAVVQEYWYRGEWKDGCTTYWKNLLNLERMPERTYADPAGNDHGTVVSYVKLQPGERGKLRFVISWNVPVAYNYWQPRDDGDNTWRNYYSTVFENSVASAKYSLENFDMLYEKTRLFSDVLQSCTLPETVKDAITANLSVIKTPTVLRLEDGSFWGWEGCHEDEGSCFGSCQHVWNYAYAMPYLFPRLERSIREITLKYALCESGATGFRVNLPLKKGMDTERSCVDGQMGEVIKCYREWKMSGDDEWLRSHSEDIFRMLEFAWSGENPDRWDADCDGVMEGRQHHTLDLELFGPSSWLQGFYLLALDCGSKMAEFLGENERAELYRRLYNNGKAWTNENLFNGKYFIQKIDVCDKSIVDGFGAEKKYWNDEAGEIKYQIADGCIIDQMLADWHAHLIGGDCIFDADKKKIALENLYKNNYKSSMREFANMWRNFALNDESGTVICSYPDSAAVPAIPISYCDETMTGFEYALAGLMIAEGYISEGETMVKAIRDRYDGEKRNPWNELECGCNYARSMASYALLPIYSGFTFDMTEKQIGFEPLSDNGKYLFSVCESYGTVEFNGESCRLTMLGNPLCLNSISVPMAEKITNVTVDGAAVGFTCENRKILLGNVTIGKEMLLS